MDNLSLEALFRELKPVLIQKSIQKVKLGRQESDLLSLRLRTGEIFGVVLSSSFPLCFLPETEFTSEASATETLAVLKKYLVGGRIVDVRKELNERVVFLEVENYRLSSQPQHFSLVLELLPSRPDVLLLDSQQQILTSLRRPISMLGEAAAYAPPRAKSQFSLEQVSQDEFLKLLRQIAASDAEQAGLDLSKRLGISPAYAKEIIFKTLSQPEICWQRFQSVLQRIQAGSYQPCLYCLAAPATASPPVAAQSKCEPVRATTRWLLTPFPFDSLPAPVLSCSSMNEACRHMFSITQKLTEFAGLQKTLLTTLQSPLRKKLHLLEKLRTDQQKKEDCTIYKKYADLLYAQQVKNSAGLTALRVVDLFAPDQRELEIPLDPKLSLIQNANCYSRLFQKANRSLPRIQQRIEVLQSEVDQMRKQQDKIRSALSLEELKKVVAPASVAASSARRRSPSALNSRPTRAAKTEGEAQLLEQRAAKRFVSSEGLPILVGKSSRDNDTLTFKVARSEDFWLHVDGYGGSHVVLRNPAKLPAPPRQSLVEAAQLAAYFSQARNAPKVEVHYTQRKFVSKPRGAKAGLVQLRDYHSVLVRPQLL